VGGSVTAPAPAPTGLPALLAPPDARTRALEFFAAHIRNPNTRRAYLAAAADFSAWCEGRGIASLGAVGPMHVAAWVEALGTRHAVPTVKQRLAAVRALFDFLVVGQVIAANPEASVRGPRHVVRRGKTAVLDGAEAARLLAAIDVTTPAGLRDRALIALMTYAFARVGAALAMRVDDVFTERRRLWVRLHEKGGKRHEMPCHHELEAMLADYLDGTGLRGDPHGYLFRTVDRRTKRLSDRPLPQANAHAMVRRRARAAGIGTAIGNHTFRATGITAYLSNNGTLEIAARMANHASTRTTQLYDRRDDALTLAEVERIRL